MSRRLRIDIYTDTVCPWCFLGKRRLQAALDMRPQLAPRLTWRPFELNPDLPLEGMQRTEFLATRVANVERFRESERQLIELGRAAGIDFRFDRIERVPNTRRSHLLISLAARRGRDHLVVERLMRAYFEEGLDIGDIDTLVRLGVECGLAEREALSALVLRTGQDAIVAAQRHAATLGLGGVPAYIFNGEYAISGAQEPAALVSMLDRVVAGAAAVEADDA